MDWGSVFCPPPMQLTSPISSENLMQSRLGELGLQSIDVGGEGDCLFRSVSHQLYGKTPNANMADHSVIARDELHESEASEASVFCFDNASPEKSSSWTV